MDRAAIGALMAGSGRLTCPSARAEDGALLLGIVAESGRITLLPQPPTVDRDFLEQARQGRPPAQRFRFASPCVERGCDKWTGGACGVGQTLAALDPERFPTSEAAGDEPSGSCPIRSTCRWRAEHGASICTACTYVVTERGTAS